MSKCLAIKQILLANMLVSSALQRLLVVLFYFIYCLWC